MAEKKAPVKVSFIQDITKYEFASYTPKDFLFAPIKPRLVNGQYGLTIQLVQYKPNKGWTQIGVKLDNVDYLAKAIEGLAMMIKSLVEYGILDRSFIATIQSARASLEDAVQYLRESENLLSSKSSKPN